jgi:phospholipid/cholesterol/gamma-HCH transport system substrate-binding protein
MSTTLPPPAARVRPPGPPRPPGDGGSGGDGDRGSGGGGRVRGVVVAALAVVVLIVAYLVLASSSAQTYHLLFSDAGQLVKGDQVQVGGVPVGTITNIGLTSNYVADITVRVNGSIAPLHQGTTAQIRSPSLSGVANRYIAISPGPNNAPTLADGATLPTTATSGIVDLDQVLDALDPATRQGLRDIIRGSAVQYAGASKAINESIPYFSPALSSADHLLAELDSDQTAFTNFIVATAGTVTALAARAPQLSGLVQNADQTFGAIGAQNAALTAGLRQLPATLQQGNTTFANLIPTLNALTRLVNVAKPDTKTLATFLQALAPLLSETKGPVTNLALAISRPGPSNDLTDVALALPALERELVHASPDTVASLQAATPITTFLRPYTPDLLGFLRTFGEDFANYDADGHYARASTVFAAFGPGADNTLTPVNPMQGLAGLQTGQTDRCPGAAAPPPADGSAPYTANGTLNCSPSEVPSG